MYQGYYCLIGASDEYCHLPFHFPPPQTPHYHVIFHRVSFRTSAGSSTPSQFVCGGPQFVCPGGTGSPLSLIGNTSVYSVPGTGLSAVTQTGTAPCPYGRLCNNGSLLPAVVNVGSCSSGSMSASIWHLNTSYAFGSNFTVSNQANPSYGGPMNWTISAYSNADAGCPATTSYFTMIQYSFYSVGLAVGSIPISIASCRSGMNLTLTSQRSSDMSLFATCIVSVSVVQVSYIINHNAMRIKSF